MKIMFESDKKRAIRKHNVDIFAVQKFEVSKKGRTTK